ncbi:hypothetical protein PW52_10900 [Tamlana sedimentorum]|uniref:CHAT domain-containing protein n=1 Tax=Neotamlana sedimentorum TaxID=1435349 RepID=A0A0D7W7T0_9FLAO|nr:CHAT domain-containing protein [Tamlana sedimentorum]KJD35181.1 hypothetical protein PW52_10900 [Tamlana sedimentorum]
MKKLHFLLFLISPFLFSQNLEERIYAASETFIANKTEAELIKLTEKEQHYKSRIKSKDEQLALVFLQCHKGFYLKETGRLTTSILSYEEASKRFFNNELSVISNFDIIESCLKPLGNLYIQINDYTNAISTINHYILLAKNQQNTKHQNSGYINLAILYQTLGKHNTALQTLELATLKPIKNNKQWQLIHQLKIKSFIALNNFKTAQALNNQLQSNFEKHKNNYAIALKLNNIPLAISEFKKAKALIKKEQVSARYLAKFYFEEAQLHVLNQNNTSAKLSLQHALDFLLPNHNKLKLPNTKSLYAENTFIDIFDLFASIETNISKALNYLDLSFYVSRLLQEKSTSQENKIQHQASNRLRSETCIHFLYNRFKNSGDKKNIIAALQYAESNKSGVLKKIATKKLRLQEFPNDSLLITEFKLLAEQERLTSELIQAEIKNSDTQKINTLSTALNSVSVELKRLQPSINEKYENYKTNKFSLEELQNLLHKDEATCLEFFFGNRAIYLFKITKNDINLDKIELDETVLNQIKNFIHLFDNASIINNNLANFSINAFRLFQLLKLERIESKNVVIIPDGLLNFVPFEALLTKKTESTLYQNMPFLVTQHNIAYNSSAVFYTQNIKPKTNKNVLGVFPVFENENQALPYSLNEATHIKEHFKGDYLIKQAATKQAFLNRVEHFGIIHLSTHASSGNFSLPANISFIDDTLFLNELYTLNLNPDLVILSACETGIGKLYKGAGAMSIARGFQYAGAENLLFSLWQINDLSTSQMMQLFYKSYKNSKSAFQANVFSKRSYLNSETISNAKKSPYYWSAFVYYGQLDNPIKNNNLIYVIIGSLISLFIVFLRRKLKRHAA